MSAEVESPNHEELNNAEGVSPKHWGYLEEELRSNSSAKLSEKKQELKQAEEKMQELEDLVKETNIISYDPICVRKKSNWSKPEDVFKFDSDKFSPNTMNRSLEDYSPKLQTLLKKIKDLDEKDKKQHGKLFKHFIFSDLKFGNYGAKMLASALIANGYNLGYKAEPKQRNKSAKSGKMAKTPKNKSSKKKYEPIELYSDAVLKKTANENFYMLSSVGVYDQNITVKMKKEMLQRFNQRPDNSHGELIRFIILDSGFKEGIDLFDVKYVHVFEPSTYLADQKQVIGRSTRTCGQKGIEFHPIYGWPLHVFIYDLEIPEKLQKNLLGSKTAMELYLKSMNLDLRLLNFTYDLEKTTVLGSVDYDLNKNVHSFSIPMEDSDAEVMYGGGPKKRKFKIVSEFSNALEPPGSSASFIRGITSDSSAKRLTHSEMRDHIKQNYSEFAWDAVKMENLCEEKAKGGSGQIINFTPTQDFVRHYFHPYNPIKGMLLYHSVGTGKTCSAIAAATSNFEKNGYTILWVTRTTLKNDIWKNMFEQVCNESIRNQIEYQNLEIPKDNKKRMRLLSKAWKIRPMSYKQFSNLVLKQNAMYESLVKINGAEDPLRKTLLIIDEAHKLYGGDDLSSIEKPDMDALKKALHHSYLYSGQDSVRLLLMTATPITKDPMELIKLVNLCKPDSEQMPADFVDFSAEYLDENGDFTSKGRAQYLDDIAGYVSYLNREKDARQFAQPRIEHIHTPIVKDLKNVEKFDKKIMREILEETATDFKQAINEETKKIEGEFEGMNKKKFAFLKDDICGDLTGKPKTQCTKVVNQNITKLIKEAKEYIMEIKTKIKDFKTMAKEQKKSKGKTLKNIRGNITRYMDEYKKYKTTLLYELKNKCSKKLKNIGKLEQELKNHPVMKEYDEEIAKYKEQMRELDTNIQSLVDQYKIRVKQLKALLKTDLNDIERNVINMVLRDERKEFGRTRRYTVKQNTSIKKELKRDIKDIEKHRAKQKREMIKNIKKSIKEENAKIKKAKRSIKDIRKTIRNKGVKNEVLKSMVDKYRDKIEEDLEEVRAAELEKQREKEAAKEQKRQEKERAREAKKREQEQKKAEKKAEKERARETKKWVQEQIKAAKQQEKLAKKQARKTKKNLA